MNLLYIRKVYYSLHLFHILVFNGLVVLQKKQLLRLDVPALFIQIALDEGPGSPIRYQYPELGKLHAVVSCLIRSCDVSSRWQSSVVSFF